MKDRFGAISKIIVIVMIAIVISGSFMLLFDSGFNGAVGDWIVANFIRYSEWTEGSDHFYTETFAWGRLKAFITIVAIGLVILWTMTIILTYILSRKGHAKRVSEETAKHILEQLSTSNPADRPVKEYAHIEPHIESIQNLISDSNRLMLEEVNKKNDLIAYLAHDLKTPLTSVVGYLSLLEEAPDMPDEQKAKYIHVALNKSLRLESLINEFFDITRYNLHQIELEKENIDLSYMLRQMTDEFYPVLESHGNTVNLAASESITISADPVKLARVFNNILKNAIAYSYPNTPIDVLADSDSKEIWVSFTNSGKTIPPGKLESIFEKFYRLDEARSSNTGGAGLGLAIAKEIVTRHGGTIRAVSENNVTTFTVTLPR